MRLSVVLLGLALVATTAGCKDEKKPAEPEPTHLKMEAPDTTPPAQVADTYVAPEDSSVGDTTPAGPTLRHKKLNIKPPIITH